MTRYSAVENRTGGVAHATALIDVFDPELKAVVTTVCGRNVRWGSVYNPGGWMRLRATWKRLSKTHKTGVCGACVLKTGDAEE